jgi:cell division protein FtsI (penicillin-binding protein 3)
MSRLRLFAPRPETPILPQPAAQVSLEGLPQNALETGRTRLVVTGVLFALAFALIGGRLVDVTVVKRGGEPRLAQGLRQAPVAERADIVDRNGLLLASSLPTASLYADTKDVIDPAEAAAKLIRALPELNEAEILAKLKSEKSFVWLRRNLTPRQEQAVNGLGIPGLYFQREDRRVYPHGALVAHALGFANIDNRGIAGIEQSLDDALRGGREPIALSIDLRVQHILREELQATIADFTAIGGAAVVLDVHSAEIVGMVSLPDFDPNRPGALPADTRFNRNTLGVYEMGSTFKIFTVAMALDAGTTTLAGGYDATEPLKISRFTIRDDHAQKRWLTTPEIFMHSSNIGSARMALDVGAAGQRAFLGKLGFLKPVPVELPESGHPLIPHPWRPINVMTIAFGHGMAVTPLHLANGLATVVNGGILRQPTLLKRPEPAIPGERVISEKTSEQMRRLLNLVVERGTGKKAAAPGYVVGGKTGTAEKVGNGGYRRKALLSSFVGAFPMHAPRYVVLVSVDEPKGNKKSYGFATAGWVAAPAVSRIVQRIGPVLGVTPVNPEAPEIRQAVAIDVTPRGGPRAGERKLASF